MKEFFKCVRFYSFFKGDLREKYTEKLKLAVIRSTSVAIILAQQTAYLEIFLEKFFAFLKKKVNCIKERDEHLKSKFDLRMFKV